MPSFTAIYTLSLHDALPLSAPPGNTAELPQAGLPFTPQAKEAVPAADEPADRKSTRLNSSHSSISYAVFHCDLHSFPTRRSSALCPTWYYCRVATSRITIYTPG